MTREEYFEVKKERVNKMTHDQLKSAYHNLDETAQRYFVAMNQSQERIKELEMYLFSIRKLDVGFCLPTDQQINERAVFYAKNGTGSKYDFEAGAKWLRKQAEGDIGV